MIQFPLEGICVENRRVYALHLLSQPIERENPLPTPPLKRSFGYSDEEFPNWNHNIEMLTELARSEAIIRILTGPMYQGKGLIFVSLPNKMSLRMRTLLSLTFCGVVAEEIDSLNEIPPLPEGLLLDVMKGLLQSLLYLNVIKSQEKTYIEDDDLFGEFPEEENLKAESGQSNEIAGTPIEKLDLSVRAYNSLKRAGVDTIEKLRTLTDDDYLHIRNLGRKAMEEVKGKLSEHIAVPTVAPLTASNYSNMLEELVGLQEVKDQINKIAAFARLKKDMASLGKMNVL